MTRYKCKRCDKMFRTEELVKTHLQEVHDIPPREIIEKMEKLKKDMLDYYDHYN